MNLFVRVQNTEFSQKNLLTANITKKEKRKKKKKGIRYERIRMSLFLAPVLNEALILKNKTRSDFYILERWQKFQFFFSNR
jgi:hypothetical protein